MRTPSGERSPDELVEGNDQARQRPSGIRAWLLFIFGGTLLVLIGNAALNLIGRHIAATVVLAVALVSAMIVVQRWEHIAVHLSAYRPRRRVLFAGLVLVLGSGAVVVGPASVPNLAQATRYPPVWDTGPSATALDGLTEQVGVANVSAGATGYSPSAPLSYDQVAKVEVVYCAGGATLPLNDIIPDVHVPTTPGVSQSVTASVSDANGAHLAQTVVLTLDDPRARLQLIPDSVMWRFVPAGSVHYSDRYLNDAVLTSATPIENLAPGAASALTFLVRVVIPAMTVQMVGRGPNSPQWARDFIAPPGATVQYQIRVRNDGDTALSDADVTASLPTPERYVRGSTTLRSPVRPDGIRWADGVISATNENAEPGTFPGVTLPSVAPGPHFAPLTGGIPVSLLPGQTVTITFSAKIAAGASDNLLMWATGQAMVLGLDAVYNVTETRIQPA